MGIFMVKVAIGTIKEVGMMESGKTASNMEKAFLYSLRVNKKNRPV